jgi:hypothetical protein
MAYGKENTAINMSQINTDRRKVQHRGMIICKETPLENVRNCRRSFSEGHNPE